MAKNASVSDTRTSSSFSRVGSRLWSETCGTFGITVASMICRCALKLEKRGNLNEHMFKLNSIFLSYRSDLGANVGTSTNSGTSPVPRPGSQRCRRERIRSSSTTTSFLSSVSIPTPVLETNCSLFAHPSPALATSFAIWKSAKLFMLSTCKIP